MQEVYFSIYLVNVLIFNSKAVVKRRGFRPKIFHEMLWQAIDSDKQGYGEYHPHPESLNSD